MFTVPYFSPPVGWDLAPNLMGDHLGFKCTEFSICLAMHEYQIYLGAGGMVSKEVTKTEVRVRVRLLFSPLI